MTLVSEIHKILKGKLEARKGALKSKRLSVNVKRTKIISSENVGKATEEGKFPCAVSRKGEDSNSILYQFCRCWLHKGCSRIRVNLKEGSKLKCQTFASEQTDTAEGLSRHRIKSSVSGNFRKVLIGERVGAVDRRYNKDQEWIE